MNYATELYEPAIWNVVRLFTLVNSSNELVLNETAQRAEIVFNKHTKMELMHGASMLSRPADEFGNDSLVEEMWAVKAMDHAEVHFNLLTSVHPSQLQLTPYDDQIYATFRQDFPDLQVNRLSDDVLKSATEKLKWRQFAEKFNKMDDYSYGTLMRADATKEFSPDNSIFVFRVQFLAIEIARNREGCNNEVHNKYKPSKKPQSQPAAAE